MVAAVLSVAWLLLHDSKRPLWKQVESGTPQEQSSAVTQLGADPAVRSSARFRSLTQNTSPTVAAAAIRSIAYGATQTDLPLFQAAVDSASPEIRSAGIEGLANVGKEIQAPKLVTMLANDDNKMVKVTAAMALGHMHHWEATPELLKAMHDPDPTLPRRRVTPWSG